MQQKFSRTADWMTGITIPLSPFSYTKLVFLPPDSITSDISASKGGGRITAVTGPVKVEAGYLYCRSVDRTFRFRKIVFSAEIFTKSLKNSLLITAGFYAMAEIGYGDTLSYRLETRIEPYGKWESSGETGLRGFVSPVDSSAVIIPGFTFITLMSLGTGSPGSTFA